MDACKVHERPDGTKSLKLGDFGLATVVTAPLRAVCGTLTYVAPEVLAETGYTWPVHQTTDDVSLLCTRRRGTLSDTAIRPSVSLSQPRLYVRWLRGAAA